MLWMYISPDAHIYAEAALMPAQCTLIQADVELRYGQAHHQLEQEAATGRRAASARQIIEHRRS